MDFKSIDLNISYRNIGEENFCTVINPLLTCAKSYKRSVGFFSSSAINFINEGIMEMVKNNGKIELATSPRLSNEDIKAIKDGYDSRATFQSIVIEQIDEALKQANCESTEKLYYLIKNGYMDIKIVLKNGGIYHDKLAVLEDYDGNVVAFVGSNNESSGGFNNNYEKIRVYRSWVEEDRVKDETEEFESIWNDSNEFLDVYDFNDAYKKELLECVERHANAKKTEKKNITELRPYQSDAKQAWINNGYCGFFEMATGTGKTLTALYSAIDLIRKEKVFTVIVAPYKHLVKQWYETITKNFSDVTVIQAYSEQVMPEKLIYAAYIKSKKEYNPIIVVSTMISFSLDRYKELYKRIEYKKLLVVDEAHNFYNKLSEELSKEYVYKLGLSATPVFGRDVEKTNTLLTWFGGKVITFTLEQALGKYLVNYNYIPIYVYATEDDESKFTYATQQMMSAIDDRTGIIFDEEKFNIAYRSRLRSISMAQEKIDKIDEIFKKIDGNDHTIIYCSDGKLFKEGKTNKETEEIKHLDFILDKINLSIENKDVLLKASKFTASEDAKTRMDMIDLFNKGALNYLVAIKCLDEGVDIPSIKNALILSSNDNYREFVQRRGRILRLHDGKDESNIYDVIVLPSKENKTFAQIEFRRYYEYARIAINKDQLLLKLDELLAEYDLKKEDILFGNDYIYGGDLDE